MWVIVNADILLSVAVVLFLMLAFNVDELLIVTVIVSLLIWGASQLE